MNCSSCGTEIPYDERFCRNCGREAVSLAPTMFAGGVAPPQSDSHITERFTDPLKTESITPPTQTAREWTPPPMQSPPPSTAPQSRRSLLVPITVASIVIALVSIGALVYFILWKDKVSGGGSTPPERPQPTASPSVTSPSPTPTPSVQPTATPTPTPIPTPNNAPPPGARLGYCNDTNVFVRSSPDLNARPVTKISRGQKLWIIATSTNYSTWNGINSNWTQVQIYNGTVRGWVFTPFVSY
jgi:hypothetical protein